MGGVDHPFPLANWESPASLSSLDGYEIFISLFWMADKESCFAERSLVVLY